MKKDIRCLHCRRIIDPREHIKSVYCSPECEARAKFLNKCNNPIYKLKQKCSYPKCKIISTAFFDKKPYCPEHFRFKKLRSKHE